MAHALLLSACITFPSFLIFASSHQPAIRSRTGIPPARPFKPGNSLRTLFKQSRSRLINLINASTVMRNGSSSAVDQTGVPVYRGPATPRTSSRDTMENSNPVHNHNDADLKARSSLDASRDKMYAKDDDESDRGHSKFKSRRSLPWYQSRELQIVGAITALAAVVRLWAIGYPTSVV